MPVSTIDLTTVAKVNAYLQQTDTTQDALEQVLITAASRLMMRDFEREWAPTATAATRTFEVEIDERGGTLNLAPYDLRTLTTLKIDTDTPTPITLSSDEYRLRPVPNPLGVYDRIAVKPLTRIARRVEWPRRQMTVLGDWGFATIPEEVEFWCNVQVGAWLPGFRSARPLSELDVDAIESRTRAAGLSSSVRWGLQHYRRVSF